MQKPDSISIFYHNKKNKIQSYSIYFLYYLSNMICYGAGRGNPLMSEHAVTKACSDKKNA